MNSRTPGNRPAHYRAPTMGRTKLDGRRWSVNFFAPLFLLLVAGCHPPRIAPAVPPGEWTTSLGSPARAAYVDDSIGSNLSVDWSEGVDPGLAVPLQVHGPVLIATTAGRAIIAMNAETGLRYWSRRYNGPIAGAALRRGDTIFLATGDRENRVHAIDIHRGRGRWSQRVGEIRVEPLLVDSSVVVVTETGRVVALATEDGRQRWITRLGESPAVSPVLASGLVFVTSARDTLYGIEPGNGTIRSRTRLPGTPTSAALVRDGVLIMALGSRQVVGVRPGAQPAVEWSADLPEPVDATPVAVGSAIFVLDRSASVWRIEAGGGVRRIAELGGAASGSLTAVGNRIVVGRLDGRLSVLNTEGDVVASLDFDDSIIAPVAAGDGVLWVPLLRGHVVRVSSS